MWKWERLKVAEVAGANEGWAGGVGGEVLSVGFQH